jgi:hypothetical protein
MNLSISLTSTSISKHRYQQDFNNALPSITGFEASGPISPSPKTAVPFVITATKLPLAVYLYTLLTSFLRLSHLVYRLKTNLFVLHISLELPVFYRVGFA